MHGLSTGELAHSPVGLQLWNHQFWRQYETYTQAQWKRDGPLEGLWWRWLCFFWTDENGGKDIEKMGQGRERVRRRGGQGKRERGGSEKKRKSGGGRRREVGGEKERERERERRRVRGNKEVFYVISAQQNPQKAQVYLHSALCRRLVGAHQHCEAHRWSFTWFVRILDFSLNYVQKRHLKVEMPIFQHFFSVIIRCDAAAWPPPLQS